MNTFFITTKTTQNNRQKSTSVLGSKIDMFHRLCNLKVKHNYGFYPLMRNSKGNDFILITGIAHGY